MASGGWVGGGMKHSPIDTHSQECMTDTMGLTVTSTCTENHVILSKFDVCNNSCWNENALHMKMDGL